MKIYMEIYERKVQMEDKILNIKKEMKCIIKQKGLIRSEKYKKLKTKSKCLSKKERKILLEECRRDYESYSRFQDIKELITCFFSALSFFIAVIGVFGNKVDVDYTTYSLLLFKISMINIAIIVILTITIGYRSEKMNETKFIIDILEK